MLRSIVLKKKTAVNREGERNGLWSREKSPSSGIFNEIKNIYSCRCSFLFFKKINEKEIQKLITHANTDWFFSDSTHNLLWECKVHD